ncbi:decapping and exoribonuclease protein-like isoform X2 [Planococcus citri]
MSTDKLNVTLKTDAFPKFQKPAVVGFFDVDHNRQIKPGAGNLKYLFKDGYSALPFDLNHGFETFTEKNRSLDNEEKLNILLQWLNKESDLKQKILSEYTEKNPSFTFVSYRGLLTTVMKTPFEYKDGWRICASKFRNFIFLCAFYTDEKKDLLAKPPTPRQQRFEYWGYKFEQYLLTESPEKYPNTSKPINSNEEFCVVFHSRLNGNGLLYGAEVDGVDHNDSIHESLNCNVLNKVKMVELKTSRHIEFEKQKLHHKRYKLLSWWCQTFLVGIENVTVGFRNDNGFVEELNSFRVKDLPKMSDNLWSAAGCMRFLDDFLNFVKATLMNEPDTTLWCFEWSPRVGHVKRRRLPDTSEYVIVPPWFSL